MAFTRNGGFVHFVGIWHLAFGVLHLAFGSGEGTGTGAGTGTGTGAWDGDQGRQQDND
jgi:hypothetical protein